MDIPRCVVKKTSSTGMFVFAEMDLNRLFTVDDKKEKECIVFNYQVGYIFNCFWYFGYWIEGIKKRRTFVASPLILLLIGNYLPVWHLVQTFLTGSGFCLAWQDQQYW